jgi:hypothetical protein
MDNSSRGWRGQQRKPMGMMMESKEHYLPMLKKRRPPIEQATRSAHDVAGAALSYGESAAGDVAGLSKGVQGSFKKGGKVKRTGVYKLHKGERVSPATKKLAAQLKF